MRATPTVLALFLAMPALGGIEHTILHGVSIGRVRAHAGPASVSGLTSESLRAAANSRLREAGIPLEPKAGATLEVNATVILDPSGTCFIRLETQVVEEARLERNGFLVTASSWGADAFIDAANADECAKDVAQAEESALNDFVDHYQAMNPATPN